MNCALKRLHRRAKNADSFLTIFLMPADFRTIVDLRRILSVLFFSGIQTWTCASHIAHFPRTPHSGGILA
jgi:hypothetical protein